jgi:hypothetical protein
LNEAVDELEGLAAQEQDPNEQMEANGRYD